jgi:hypothetical protein
MRRSLLAVSVVVLVAGVVVVSTVPRQEIWQGG